MALLKMCDTTTRSVVYIHTSGLVINGKFVDFEDFHSRLI